MLCVAVAKHNFKWVKIEINNLADKHLPKYYDGRAVLRSQAAFVGVQRCCFEIFLHFKDMVVCFS